MIDLFLDLVEHDLVVANYDLVLVADADQVRQATKMRLLTIFSEWFLDTRVGIRYFDVVCTKNPDLSLIDSIMKATIIETPGIRELLSYSSEIDRARRTLTISFEANTTYGNINLSLGVP
jgi:hypothetical protein